MKRTKDNEGREHFQKIGGGSLRLPGRIIKPNQKFWAFPHELPANARDVIISLGTGEPLKKVEKEAPVVEEVKAHEYTLKHRSGGYYWIVDSNGKVVGEEALKKDEAQALIDQLEGE